MVIISIDKYVSIILILYMPNDFINDLNQNWTLKKMKHEKDESIELNLNCGHVWVLHERPLYRESMPKWRDIFVIYKHRANASECVWWYVYTHDRRQYLWNAIFVTSIMQRIRTSCAYAIFQIVFFTLSWDYVGSHISLNWNVRQS